MIITIVQESFPGRLLKESSGLQSSGNRRGGDALARREARAGGFAATRQAGVQSLRERFGKQIAAVLAGIFATLILMASAAFAGSSVNVPLDDWSYDALERLAGFGLLQSDMKGTKPYTRNETARLALEALYKQKASPDRLPELAEGFLRRFQKEYKNELAELGWGDGYTGGNFLKPVDEVKLRYVFSEGEPRRFIGFPEGHSRINGTEGTPLIYNNEGVVYGENHNGTLQFSSSMQVFGIFSGYLEPIFLAREDKGHLNSFNSVDAQILKGYAKASPWNIEFEIGRDSLWWGQGYHGTLLLTDNAPPLDMMKLSNPKPFLLPWIFQYLGPFKYVILLARLEENRDFPHALLGGMRVDFKPTPNLEIGMSRTFMFGGEGSSNNSFLDYIKILSFQNFGGGNTDATNQLASFDMRLRIPSLRNAEFYLEWGGEDTGFKPKIKQLLLQDLGYLIGVYLPRLTDDGRTDLRIEYADNVSELDQSFWYGHTQYFTGYTYRGLILGHPMGSDARDVFGRVTRYLREGLLVGLDFDYRERGRNLGPVIEQNYQLGADISFDFCERTNLKARYGFEEVKNFNLTQGDDRQNHVLSLQVKRQF